MSEEQTKSSNDHLAKYFREITECGNETVQKLATIVGREPIARYLSYLDAHKTLADPEPTFKDHTGSVLGKKDITLFFNRSIPLIDPPKKELKKIEPASYQLRLGSRCRIVDEKGVSNILWLSDNQKILRIPPHGIAVVSTYEWLNIPGCLIGRWNLKVRKVYEGLVWVGSLQVDPGYQGFLFCPIYNLSSEPRELIYTDTLFTIDFVCTTPKDNGKFDIWELTPDNRYFTFDFDRLDEKRIKSAPQEQFAKIDKDIKTLEEEVKTHESNLQQKMLETKSEVETKSEHYFEINLVLIGILFTAIGVIAGFGLGSVHWFSDWMPAVMAAIALVLAIIAVILVFVRTRKRTP